MSKAQAALHALREEMTGDDLRRLTRAAAASGGFATPFVEPQRVYCSNHDIAVCVAVFSGVRVNLTGLTAAQVCASSVFKKLSCS